MVDERGNLERGRSKERDLRVGMDVVKENCLVPALW